MKTMWIAVLGFLSFFMVTSSGVVQAEEKVTLLEKGYFLAISFAEKDPNRRRFKFNESVTQLDVEALYTELERVEGLNQVFLYMDGIAISREAGTPWEELEKKVMHVLKDQYKMTKYVLYNGDKLTEKEIQAYLTGQ